MKFEHLLTSEGAPSPEYSARQNALAEAGRYAMAESLQATIERAEAYLKFLVGPTNQ